MPRSVSPGERRTNQLLVRITDGEFEVLQAASHLRGLSPNAYAHELLRSHLSRLESDEFVQKDVANRRAFARSQSSVSPLTRSAARTVDSENVGRGEDASTR